MRRLAAVVTLLISACGGYGDAPPPSEPKPGQREAMALVWSLYGGRGDPPEVAWHEDLGCTESWGDQRPFSWHHPDFGCITGQWHHPGLIESNWWPDARFSMTSLAHEMAHEHLWRTKGTPDYGHTSRNVWYSNGTVERADAALKDAGY